MSLFSEHHISHADRTIIFHLQRMEISRANIHVLASSRYIVPKSLSSATLNQFVSEKISLKYFQFDENTMARNLYVKVEVGVDREIELK